MKKIVEEVVNYLEELGYLNDYQFCQFWIEDRSRLSLWVNEEFTMNY